MRKAKESYSNALEAFDPSFRNIAGEFFAKNWIDAEIRKGKRGGAFCASPSPQLHPYILCNYDDNLRDVMTVAHELGHGLHGCLSRKQNYFNYDTPLTTAETASVFGEMLVFDYLLGAANRSARCRSRCSAGKIEDIFATVFRQNVLTRFEELAFAARQAKRLTPEAIGTTLARSQRQVLRRRRRHARQAIAGAGLTFPTSSTRASIATATSSASCWSSPCIECTRTKAKASCRNILPF